MRFSISLPQRDTDGFDESGFKSYVARAEELGFEGGWTLEQTVGPAPHIAPLELLSYAAACTTRLRLGVAVLITSLHDPLQLASTACSLPVRAATACWWWTGFSPGWTAWGWYECCGQQA